MASNLLITTFLNLSTSYPHHLSHCRPQVCGDLRGAGGETPPFRNATGGGIRRAVVRSPAVTVTRHTQARPLPLVPVRVPITDAAALLFLCRPPLSPARAEPHPPHLVPPGLDLCPPHPRQEFRKPPLRPPPPSPPHGDSNTNDQQSVEATREPSPEDAGAGGGGRRTQCPVAPEITQPISQTVVSFGDIIVGWVAVAVDDNGEDDGGGRRHQATTNPMMATMAAVADDDSDGERRQKMTKPPGSMQWALMTTAVMAGV